MRTSSGSRNPAALGRSVALLLGRRSRRNRRGGVQGSGRGTVAASFSCSRSADAGCMETVEEHLASRRPSWEGWSRVRPLAFSLYRSGMGLSGFGRESGSAACPSSPSVRASPSTRSCRHVGPPPDSDPPPQPRPATSPGAAQRSSADASPLECRGEFVHGLPGFASSYASSSCHSHSHVYSRHDICNVVFTFSTSFSAYHTRWKRLWRRKAQCRSPSVSRYASSSCRQRAGLPSHSGIGVVA